ncbi:MAG TPA: HEAT repeat domain-containing protein [Planctomycetota bacterium]|nr:HEAT repeat domain-containing protein [Planctomycetota bacterium]
MKTQQRTTILTLSGTAIAIALAAVVFLRLRDPGRTEASLSAQAGELPAGASQAPTAGLEADAARQALDQRTEGELASGLFSAAPGTQLAFDIVNTGSSTVSNHEGGVLQSFEVDLHGELAVQVLARRDDELAFAILLPNSKFVQRVAGKETGAEGSQAIASSFARPVIVRAKVDGTTLGFRFDAQAEPDERNRMRALWGSLMPVAPQPLGETWSAEQQTVLGAMRCNYRLADEQGARVEIERTSRECIAEDPSHPIPKLSGTTLYGIDRGLGWFDSVVAEEFTSIEVDITGWTVLSQQSTRCTLTGVRHDGAVGIDWDAEWTEVSGAPDAALLTQQRRGQQLRDALNGRSLDQLIDELDALLAIGDPAAPELVRLRDEIGFLLRTDAGALAKVAELVLDPRLSPEVVATLIDCVGRAGTPEAQALLAEWISDADRAKEFRAESVYALIELKQPGDGVVAAVAGLLAEQGDSELHASALLTMGALANIGGSHTPAGSAAFHHVMNWKESAEESGRLPEWIEALGNTGSPQVVDAVRPYLTHEDDLVRASAVHALRMVFTLEVSDIAAVRGQEDSSANVRGRAAEVLGARVDSHARTAIAGMLDNEQVEDVRRTLILYLGSQVASDAVARALLEDAAATDPSAELRQLANEQLSGVHQG